MAVKSELKTQKVTFKTIAEALGVARSTVSNAYNRPDQLSPALRKQILAKAKELSYAGPDPMAASLRRGTAGAIGVVYPSPLSYTFTDPAASLFIQGIALEAERSGYGLLLIGDSSSENEPGGISLAAKAHVDGFILHNFPGKTSLLRDALGRNLPSVLVDQQPVDQQSKVELPSVTTDDRQGAYLAAKHLLGLGHTRLGIISLELSADVQSGVIDEQRQAQAKYLPTKERLAGYTAAVFEAGLAWDNLSVYETEDNTLQEGAKAASALLAQSPRPTALLAMSDQLALGALAYAKRQDILVPDSFSIVGYDDSPSAATANPPLTTVRQPHLEKGRQATSLLIAQLRGEATKSIVLETELVIRGSSASVIQRS